MPPGRQKTMLLFWRSSFYLNEQLSCVLAVAFSVLPLKCASLACVFQGAAAPFGATCCA